MSVVYVNIGSNLGNRRNLLDQALEKIGEEFRYFCISDVVESEPWGFHSSHRFLNVGVAFKSELPPEALLDRLQAIERSLSSVSHRDSEGKYKDREIDIDIMAVENVRYNSSRLHIPHIHLLEREFFLIPLQQLSPNWRSLL